MPINVHNKSAQSGITLIELVIFIVILATGLTAITLVYITTTRHSADPLVRIKGVELAQLTLNEILLKKYDENTPLIVPDDIITRCVEHAPTRCTSGDNAATNTIFGPDTGETNRTQYDDVDDYADKLYCGNNVTAAKTACPTLTCETLRDESGVDISTQYNGFSVCIKVNFAGGTGTEISNFSAGVDVETNDAKRIDVFVTGPSLSKISLTAYSLNY